MHNKIIKKRDEIQRIKQKIKEDVQLLRNKYQQNILHKDQTNRRQNYATQMTSIAIVALEEQEAKRTKKCHILPVAITRGRKLLFDHFLGNLVEVTPECCLNEHKLICDPSTGEWLQLLYQQVLKNEPQPQVYVITPRFRD